VVAGLDPAVADGFLERQGYGRARRIAVFVDVDRDPLDRQADAPRGGVDDAEVGLVGDPEVDLVEPNSGRLETSVAWRMKMSTANLNTSGPTMSMNGAGSLAA